jgi:hypothetical protein
LIDLASRISQGFFIPGFIGAKQMQINSDGPIKERLLTLHLEHRTVRLQIIALGQNSKENPATLELLKKIKRINSEKLKLSSEYNNAAK